MAGFEVITEALLTCLKFALEVEVIHIYEKVVYIGSTFILIFTLLLGLRRHA